MGIFRFIVIASLPQQVAAPPKKLPLSEPRSLCCLFSMLCLIPQLANTSPCHAQFVWHTHTNRQKRHLPLATRQTINKRLRNVWGAYRDAFTLFLRKRGETERGRDRKRERKREVVSWFKIVHGGKENESGMSLTRVYSGKILIGKKNTANNQVYLKILIKIPDFYMQYMVKIYLSYLNTVRNQIY